MTDWNVEEALETIRHGGRFGAKRIREAVYKDNVEVFRNWGYKLPSGRIVGLGERDALLTGTKVYSRAFNVDNVPSHDGGTKIGCANAD